MKPASNQVPRSVYGVIWLIKSMARFCVWLGVVMISKVGISAALPEEVLRLEKQHIESVNSRNLGYFDAEVQKLDAWADDLKVGLENEVKELDREIKDVRRTATVAATLEEKLHWQKRQRELEDKRNQLRRKIFDRQDEIDGQRNRLIEELESRLSRQAESTKVFTVQWCLD